jgi:hypothetical protein
MYFEPRNRYLCCLKNECVRSDIIFNAVIRKMLTKNHENWGFGTSYIANILILVCFSCLALAVWISFIKLNYKMCSCAKCEFSFQLCHKQNYTNLTAVEINFQTTVANLFQCLKLFSFKVSNRRKCATSIVKLKGVLICFC